MAIASGQSVRVLLISASEGVRDQLAAALNQRSNDYRLYWVSQPELAFSRAHDLVPHVIVVDDELGGTASVVLINNLTQRVPSAALIALVSPNAVGKANQAVLAGARGFLVKPLQVEELISTMRLVLTGRTTAPGPQLTDDKAGKIIAICAPKGGTGRTTMAINVGYWLAQLSKAPVALIDADYSSPALDVALNLHSDHSIIDLLPRIARLDAELVESVIEEHNSGLKVLLAPAMSLLDQEISLPHVQQILAQMQRMFSWVVVDLGLPLAEMAYAFLDGADQIVMTVLPEMVGLRNATGMLEQMRLRGYPDDRVWLVINRASLRGGINRQDIEQHLHVRVKHVIPDDQPLATYAINRGVPFSMSHPNSAVSKAMRGMAELLMQNSKLPDEVEEPATEVPARKPLFAWPKAKRPQITEH